MNASLPAGGGPYHFFCQQFLQRRRVQHRVGQQLLAAGTHVRQSRSNTLVSSGRSAMECNRVRRLIRRCRGDVPVVLAPRDRDAREAYRGASLDRRAEPRDPHKSGGGSLTNVAMRLFVYAPSCFAT
jgi:hypothetical protein